MKHCAICKYLDCIIQDEIVCTPPAPCVIEEVHCEIVRGMAFVWCDHFEERLTFPEFYK